MLSAVKSDVQKNCLGSCFVISSSFTIKAQKNTFHDDSRLILMTRRQRYKTIILITQHFRPNESIWFVVQLCIQAMLVKQKVLF